MNWGFFCGIFKTYVSSRLLLYFVTTCAFCGVIQVLELVLLLSLEMVEFVGALNNFTFVKGITLPE